MATPAEVVIVLLIEAFAGVCPAQVELKLTVASFVNKALEDVSTMFTVTPVVPPAERLLVVISNAPD